MSSADSNVVKNTHQNDTKSHDKAMHDPLHTSNSELKTHSTHREIKGKKKESVRYFMNTYNKDDCMDKYIKENTSRK